MTLSQGDSWVHSSFSVTESWGTDCWSPFPLEKEPGQKQEYVSLTKIKALQRCLTHIHPLEKYELPLLLTSVPAS